MNDILNDPIAPISATTVETNGKMPSQTVYMKKFTHMDSNKPEGMTDVDYNQIEISKLERMWGDRNSINFRLRCVISDYVVERVLMTDKKILDRITLAIGPAEATRLFYTMGAAMGLDIRPPLTH